MGYKPRYRPATQEEIQQAGRDVAYLQDWNLAHDYAVQLFGASVARVKLVMDHNFDDGEETRYVQSGFYGAQKPSSYETVEKDGYWYQPDSLHRGWDAKGNELPMLAVLRNHYLYSVEGNDLYAPEFSSYDAWHMEFDFTKPPDTTVLYVKEK